jgi:feruloyl-CoA synthase
VIGLPAKGSLVKLVPVQQKLELRVRGPAVTPGYWRQPEITATAFDDEGFYRLGDAVRLLDERDATRGLVFDGRIGEDFKLSNGTWVSVGPLRAELIAALSPLAQDVVIAAPNADFVAALIIPDLNACARALHLARAPSYDEMAHDANLQRELQARLLAHAHKNTASTRRICRALLLPSAPSLDRGEITDKGSINQRAVLRARVDLVAALYAPTCAGHIIEIDEAR